MKRVTVTDGYGCFGLFLSGKIDIRKNPETSVTIRNRNLDP